MRRFTALALVIAAVSLSGLVLAQGRIKQQGRAIVEYDGPDVVMVAAYEYSQRHHAGDWLLIETAIRTSSRVAIHRDELALATPDERRLPVASQQQFLDDSDQLTRLLQNAQVSRRPLDGYFRTRVQRTISFFAKPGGIVHDSAASNLDEVAAGDLLFKAPDGGWKPGTYRLVLNHAKAKAELPITLD